MPTYVSQMSKTQLSEWVNYKVEKAIESIGQFNGVVVALSAGVDSSLVALLSKRALGDRAVAVTAVSESLPPGEMEMARKVAAEIGIRHLIVHTDEIHNPNYTSNPTNRCYYCKDTLYQELAATAADLGLHTILDGTQLDDLSDDRPGLQAAREAGVRSPLLDAGLNKQEVREAARCLGLSVWDKSAMPCLSSRIVHGEEVTVGKLSSIGEAELFIKNLTGVRELRVRYQNDQARIEVSPQERHLFFNEETMDQINQKLTTLGFSKVTLDLAGYRRNSVALLPVEGSTLPMVEPGHS
jgi:uncharacterized protein